MSSSYRYSGSAIAAPGLIALIALTACSPAPNSQVETQAGNATEADSAGSSQSDRLQVVTTFLPMTQFTRAVAGSCAEVSQLLPGNAGPHDYQAKPTDAQRLSQADVLVQNGLELEQFLEPMIANAGNESLLIIDSSEGLPLRAMEALHGDDHDHEHEEHAHDDHDHDHEDHGDKAASGHAGHNHGEFDPHVWLDPLLAAQQVNNIRDGLIAAEPSCEAEFTANAADYTDQLNALHQATAQALEPFSGKTFVIYHDFAGYFGDRYNIKPEFLVSVPEQDPSPTDVQRVIEAAQASDLSTLLVESDASARPFEAIAQDLGVSISTFSPNAVGDGTGPETYFTVMEENIANLQAAFGQEISQE